MDVIKVYGTSNILASDETDIAEKILELIKKELPKEDHCYAIVKGIIDTADSLLDGKGINL